MKKSIVSLLFLVFASCNPVGEDLAEVVLVPNSITSIQALELKKGEEIVFWSKVATSESISEKNYSLKYSISLNDKIISYDSTYVKDGDHIINSKVIANNGFLSSIFAKEGEERSKEVEYEAEKNSFKVPEDGKYDFDFKMNNPGDDFIFRDRISIVIKGKK